jgi:hypothetical protein
MSELLSLLENPLIQLFLIAGAVMGLTWVSEQEEQRRVARGLPRKALKDRVLQGIGIALPAQPDKPEKPEKEDIWVTAARELELPIEKVLQLKERVQQGEGKQARKTPKKDIPKQG